MDQVENNESNPVELHQFENHESNPVQSSPIQSKSNYNRNKLIRDLIHLSSSSHTFNSRQKMMSFNIKIYYYPLLALSLTLTCLALATVSEYQTQVLVMNNTGMAAFDNRVTKSSDPVLPAADGFPRVLIAQPCAGSSATIKFATVILEAHGYAVLRGGQPLLRPKKKDRFYNDAKHSLKQSLGRDPSHHEIMSESLILFNKRAVLENQIVLFKVNNIPKYIMDTLESMDTKFAFTYRRNTLDRAICAVRDCFVADIPIGHQVFPNGTVSDLCFNRRFSHEKVMAKFDDVELLMSYMEGKDRSNEKRVEAFSTIVAPSTDVAYEDLFAFEYTNSVRVLESSVKEWCNLLRNFGDIREDVVKEVLIPYWNSMEMEKSHSSVIYNANEIKDALDASPFRDYYRK